MVDSTAAVAEDSQSEATSRRAHDRKSSKTNCRVLAPPVRAAAPGPRTHQRVAHRAPGIRPAQEYAYGPGPGGAAGSAVPGAACVVVASGGYPGDYEKGKKIVGLEEAQQIEDVVVFHAGTKDINGDIVTNGGRVLGVTALGDTIDQAKQRAYRAVETIKFEDAYCRHDIADKAIKASVD